MTGLMPQGIMDFLGKIFSGLLSSLLSRLFVKNIKLWRGEGNIKAFGNDSEDKMEQKAITSCL